MRRSSGVLLALSLLLLVPAPALLARSHPAQSEKTAKPADVEPPSLEEKTSRMQKRDGYLPVYWDVRTGRVFLEIARFGEEMLYYTSLPRGVGSNDIGLDRGQVGRSRLVRFERVGPKVLLVEENTAFRAPSGSPEERRAVEESFASSVLWGFEVTAESGSRVLVDATAFLLRDGHDVAETLARAKQGKYAIDPSRSAPCEEGMRAFPANTELEATLTFTTSDEPGDLISSVAPAPAAVTVREHHSFVQLPGPGFTMRPADPRAGYFGVSYADYASPLGAPLVKRFASRHRLHKRSPAEPSSEPLAPIIYYVDPAAPEPIRSAILEGARWWDGAFEKAGYKGAFRVELLPPGVDPMDVRYNVIEWVHRSTRGWSYGSSIIDPRTGEILKGHVTLGSLRVRQDYLLAEGLLSPYITGAENPPEPTAMALARIRQLAAHEVGHTLGLEHNFLASTLGPQGRASVMDYPHPLTRLAPDGTIDLTNAYAKGIGAWDDVAIAWGYQDFPAATDEPAALERMLADARERGLVFLTDQDARPFSSAHPQASLWDNGTDAAAELDRVMDVRRAALARFGENAIRTGRPLATMEEALVPLYLHHRYQTAAAMKAIGGAWYAYALRGDGQTSQRPVSAAEQERALAAVLRTLRPEELAIPRSILETIPPRPSGYDPDRELFSRHTGVTFDPLAPAEAAARLTVSLLLDPDRVSRLIAQKALDPSLPDLDSVLDRLLAETSDPPQGASSLRSPGSGARRSVKVPGEARARNNPAASGPGGPTSAAASSSAPAARNPYEAEIARTVRQVVVDGILDLAARGPMPQVRAIARMKLEDLKTRLEAPAATDPAERASRRALEASIGRFLEGKEMPKDLPAPLRAPPGEPIGDAQDESEP